MRGSDPGALRFVLVASSVALAVVAQQLIRDGNLRLAVAPLAVAVAAIVLSVARRPLSTFDSPAAPTTGPPQNQLPLSVTARDASGRPAGYTGRILALISEWRAS